MPAAKKGQVKNKGECAKTTAKSTKNTAKTSVKISASDIVKLRVRTSAGMALCKEALEETGGDMDKAVKYINARSDVVGRLYNITGAKIGLCKIALAEANNDFEEAVEIIKKRGWFGETSAEGAEQKPKEGVIGCYIHGVNHKIAALVEVFCDTDFVARDEKFRKFAHELAMQVAAFKALYADIDSIPADVIEARKKEFSTSAELKNKPPAIVEKILEGKMRKFYEEACLLEQKYYLDETKKVSELLNETITTIGEKISIGRIYRMELGG